MKRSLLLLALLLAFTVRALATDVTVSSMTVDGFNPSNIGVDRSIAVSTAGGSPTVTSAALFPPTIVGMGGFTVRIDGLNYAVASVASTSSLTLTTNYSGTPGAQTMTLFRYVEMRVYADRAFQPLGGAQIVQPGTVGSGNFFRRFGASVVNNGSTNQLLIPQIVLPATTDALITNQAKYTFPFYTPGGAKLEFFLCPSSLAQLRLPPATPTTWTAICQFNSPSAIVPPNNEAYTKTAIDARLPSCTLNNGVFYSASGNILSCLTFGSGLTVTGSTLTASAGGSGYATVQEEGAPLAQRAVLNFIGTAFTAADEGPTRTNLSADPDLNALASIAGTGFSARTGADTWLLRTLTAPAAGLTITNPAGVAGNPTFALANDLNAVEGLATTGLAARTASDTWTTRTITQPAAGITVTNGGGVAGNPTLALANDLNAVEGLGSTGLAARTATDTWAVRSLTQPVAGLTITNPAGIAGNPTFALANDLNAVEGLSATGAAFRTGADTWAVATGVSTDGINVTFGSTNLRATRPRFVTSIDDTNGNELLAITATGSAVNEISITNAATGEGPTIAVSGGDANPNLNINAKGTGRVVIKGYPFNLESNTATTGNVGGGADVLHTFSLPAGSLAADGDNLRVRYSGKVAATGADTVNIVVSFGGQTVHAFNGIAGGTGGTWSYSIVYARVSATTVRATLFGASFDTTTDVDFTVNVLLTVTDLAANAQTMQVTGESVTTPSNDDITQNVSEIDLVQR